jgi:hypothetical protein
MNNLIPFNPAPLSFSLPFRGRAGVGEGANP